MDDKTGPILFCGRNDPCFFLANFSPYGFFCNNTWWRTAEHYYQAAKCGTEEDVEWVRTAPDPKTAKMRARACSERWIEDWEERRERTMTTTVRNKFSVAPVMKKLLDTGNRKLVEHRKADSFWGDGPDGRGENKLGKILMQVRDELKHSINKEDLSMAVKEQPEQNSDVFVERPKITDCYIDTMTEYLVKLGGDPAKCRERITQLTADRLKDKRVTVQYSEKRGRTHIKRMSLGRLLNDHRTDVISPSGSIYVNPHRRKGFIAQMVQEQMKNRKHAKKQQFEAERDNDKTSENYWYYTQTNIKVNMNALPGGFASPHNIFYDKGGYNTITSLARALIATAYTGTERLLEGNFSLFDEETAINHVLTSLAHCPKRDRIMDVVGRFSLETPSTSELMEFLLKELHKYNRKSQTFPVLEQMVNSLKDFEVVYLYYLKNFKHLLRRNDYVGKTWMRNCLDVSTPVDVSSVEAEDIYSIDEDLLAVMTPLIHEQLDGVNPMELPKVYPEKAKWYTALLKRSQKHIDSWKEVLDTFIFRPGGMPSVENNNQSVRETVIGSDTDSVIFTDKNWVEWFSGENADEKATYAPAAFIVYWLSKLTEHNLQIFGTLKTGNREEKEILAMKNEFYYPAMLLFALTKKTYTGLPTIQEGQVKQNPEIDIKGILLKGSNVAIEATKWLEKFLTNEILVPGASGEIDPHRLLRKVLEFENSIRDSIFRGDNTYTQKLSVRDRDYYKNPMSSPYLYWLAWQEIFAPDYGQIAIPTKVPAVPLKNVDKEFLGWLHDNSPKVFKRLEMFKKKYNAFPNIIVVNPMADELPKEIRQWMDIRKSIIQNMKPTYRVLDQLGLGVGLRKQNVLISDIYE